MIKAVREVRGERVSQERTKLIFKMLGVFGVLFAVAIFAFSWTIAQTRRAVGDFIRDPKVVLSDGDARRVSGYVTRKWYYYPFSHPLEYSDEELTFAVIRYTETRDSMLLHDVITEYQAGRGFKSLPQCVANSVNTMMDGSWNALLDLRGRVSEPGFEEIMAEKVFTECKNVRLVAAMMIAFPPETIRQHPESYSIILQRSDISDQLRDTAKERLKKILEEKTEN